LNPYNGKLQHVPSNRDGQSYCGQSEMHGGLFLHVGIISPETMAEVAAGLCTAQPLCGAHRCVWSIKYALSRPQLLLLPLTLLLRTSSADGGSISALVTVSRIRPPSSHLSVQMISPNCPALQDQAACHSGRRRAK
jgi:hypothetical protein